MNIFEMYYENGKRCGFFVQRRSWRNNLLAKIVSISGITEGALKGLGRYPYFNEAKEKVLAEMYEVVPSPDNPDQLLLRRAEIPPFAQAGDGLAKISCPGASGYHLVEIETAETGSGCNESSGHRAER